MSLFRRILASIGIVCCCLVMVVGMLCALFQSTRVQTAMVRVVAQELSRGLQTKVEVGEVGYAFPNRLLIHDVLICDQTSFIVAREDTLLYVDTLAGELDVRMLWEEERVLLHTVRLCGTRAYAHQVITPTGDTTMNYQFLVDAFAPRKKEDKPKTPMPIAVEIEQVEIRDAKVRYNEWELAQINMALALHRWDSLGMDVELMRLTAQGDINILESKARLQIDSAAITLPELIIRADVRGEEIAAKAALSAKKNETGQFETIQASTLELMLNGERVLLGEAEVMGLNTLPSRDSLYVDVNCQDLFFNKGMAQDAISKLKGKPFELPQLLARLGNVHYRGRLSGRLENLRLQGAFTTALGCITTNGTVMLPDDISQMYAQGEIGINRFKLGKLLQNKDLGDASLRVVGTYEGNNRGTLQAVVNKLDWRGYCYHDIRLNGTLNHGIFEGKCDCADPNLAFHFEGEADLKTRGVHVDCELDVEHLRLGELGISEALSKKYPTIDLQWKTHTTLHGANMDNLTGSLIIDSLLLTNEDKQMLMKQFALRLTSGDALSVYSDFLTMSIHGQYKYSDLILSMEKMLVTTLPHAVSGKTRSRILSKTCTNRLDMELYLRDIDKVTDVLGIPVRVRDGVTLKASLNDLTPAFRLQAVVPDVQKGSQHWENISLLVDNDEGMMEVLLAAYQHHTDIPASKQMGDIQWQIGLSGRHDNLALVLDWQNTDSIKTAGTLQLQSRFASYDDQPMVSIQLLPTHFYLSDTLWTVNPSKLCYVAADTLVSVDGFRLASDRQLIDIHGVAGRHMSDTLHVQLENVDLDYFLGSLTAVHRSMYFGGYASGWARGYALLKKPTFEANMEMLHAKVNGVEVGDVFATAELDNDNHVLVHGNILETLTPNTANERRKQVCTIEGVVNSPKWDIDIIADSVRVSFVDYWLNSILQDVDGRASGHVHVGGGKDPQTGLYTFVTCEAQAHHIGLTLPFTGGRYYTDDHIRMDTTAIYFDHVHLTDPEGNPLTFTGSLHHNGEFVNMQYNFDVHADHALCMDLPEKINETLGGKAYATGDVHIEGNDNLCKVDVRGRSTSGTNMAVCVVGASNASKNDFIRFVDHNAVPEPETEAKKVATLGQVLHAKGTDLELNMFVEVTPEAVCRIIIDPRCGDQAKGRGEGAMRIRYTDKDGLSMLGNYTLQQGTFTFTLQNVIRREFEIAEGSTLRWNGIPEEPDVDIRALYHVTASLKDLFGSDQSQVNTNRSSIPVNCVLHITDKLLNPVLHFGIELPSSDESVSSQVRSVINTEDMLTRQVLYLLVFNRFYTPEYLQNTQNRGLNETYSLLSSTVTGQINHWLGKMTDAFSLGFNFRTDGEGANSSQEYEAQFQIRPVSGLIIDGNFGYRYNDISDRPVFGNLDVEYMLTKNGKLRAKAYTHTVDKYSLRQANTVQGVGVVLKHDFNWPEPIRRTPTIQQDSLPTDTLSSTY